MAKERRSDYEEAAPGEGAEPSWDIVPTELLGDVSNDALPAVVEMLKEHAAAE